MTDPHPNRSRGGGPPGPAGGWSHRTRRSLSYGGKSRALRGAAHGTESFWAFGTQGRRFRRPGGSAEGARDEKGGGKGRRRRTAGGGGGGRGFGFGFGFGFGLGLGLGLG